MADPYIIPRRLDDPELIGFWTIDEFAGMLAPFTWGILTQHIFIGIIVAFGAWFALRKAKAGRASSWVGLVLHLAQLRCDRRDRREEGVDLVDQQLECAPDSRLWILAAQIQFLTADEQLRFRNQRSRPS